MTCRQETKHKNKITVKGQKKFQNKIFKNKTKYTYTMPPKIFGHLINTSRMYEFYCTDSKISNQAATWGVSQN